MTLLGPSMLVSLLLGVVTAVILVAASPAASGLRPNAECSAPVMKRDLTLSFDAKPAYSEWWTIQPGYSVSTGPSISRHRSSRPPRPSYAMPRRATSGTASTRLASS